MILARHAQHLDDDLDRQRVGVVGHQVGVALVEGDIEKLVADLLDARPEPVDDARGERLLDEPAQAGVVGWVTEQERGHLDQDLTGTVSDVEVAQAAQAVAGPTFRPSLLDRLSRSTARQSA